MQHFLCLELVVCARHCTHGLNVIARLIYICCRLLSKLFPTRVKLAPPPEGAAAAKHNSRIAKDADKILARNNYRVLKTLSSAVG